MDERYLYGWGIYGIYVDNTLVYVGMTNKTFHERFKEYKRDLEDPEKDRKVLKFIRKNKGKKKIQMRIIINVPELKLRCTHFLSERDIQLMELALISEHKPILNVQGVDQLYPLKYSKEEKELIGNKVTFI